MARVRFSRRARLEVLDIAEYLAQLSPPAAERFRVALDGAVRRLAEFPDSGAPGLRPGTRRLVIGDYIVSYRHRDIDVEVFAVRHARRRNSRI